MTISQFLYDHVQSRNYKIQLFEVSEENLKNLKNIKLNFQANSHQNYLSSFSNDEDISKKEKMEYMIGNIVLNTRIKKLSEECTQLQKKIEDYQKDSS